jgi:CHAT domain-containing protein
MTGYYRRLKQKKGRSEALRLTQIKMLRSSDYSHPYYWASFIPSGDWTPMQ